MIEPGIVLTAALTVVGAVVWAVRVEGRVNGHDRLFIEREKHVDTRHAELQTRLERIEQTLDGIYAKMLNK